MKRILITLLLVAVSHTLEAQDTKNIKILSFKTKKEVMDFMKKNIAPSLGVKCAYCHNVRDFPS
ncbi:MAG TPA: hypothetical protein EYG62_07910, partial [Candidatus Marinimicrobia bacterium]|nr:hypothetical protein [Candidatus Neomarinimicrobiota bacterium]